MPRSLIGTPKAELDTPALCLDIEAVEANIQRMADYFRDSPVRLRPHAKTHKCPTLARMQLAAGAIGITCAKLGEAEVLAAAGIKDILIANQIIGAGKIARLVNLAAYTEVMVAVDDAANVAELDAAAQAKGVRLRVVIEVDIGMARCGVQPGEPALDLARQHRRIPRPALRGGDGLRGPHDLPPRPGGAPRADRTQRQAAGGHGRSAAAQRHPGGDRQQRRHRHPLHHRPLPRRHRDPGRLLHHHGQPIPRRGRDRLRLRPDGAGDRGQRADPRPGRMRRRAQDDDARLRAADGDRRRPAGSWWAWRRSTAICGGPAARRSSPATRSRSCPTTAAPRSTCTTSTT